MIATLDQLNPTTRAAADAMLDAAVGAVPAGLRDDLRDELTIALCEGLDVDAGPDELAAVVADLGPVDAIFAEESGDHCTIGRRAGSSKTRGSPVPSTGRMPIPILGASSGPGAAGLAVT